MKKEIFPLGIEVETTASSNPKLRQSFMNITFRLSGSNPGPVGNLKIDFDLELAARVEEAIKKSESLTLTIE